MNWLHDIHWVLALRTPGLTHLAFGLTWLGYSGFLMFFMVLGYWCVSQKLFYRLLLLLAINGISNAYLKDVFQQPRPPLAWRLDDLVGHSYGLPSGHAQMGVAIWLWLAWQIRRPWAWVLFPTLALGICASRIYLGAHDLEQVLVGGALGALSVLLLQGLLNLFGDWRPPLAAQLVAAGLVAHHVDRQVGRVQDGVGNLTHQARGVLHRRRRPAVEVLLDVAYRQRGLHERGFHPLDIAAPALHLRHQLVLGLHRR